jgi:hypothetical protein
MLRTMNRRKNVRKIDYQKVIDGYYSLIMLMITEKQYTISDDQIKFSIELDRRTFFRIYGFEPTGRFNFNLNLNLIPCDGNFTRGQFYEYGAGIEIECYSNFKYSGNKRPPTMKLLFHVIKNRLLDDTLAHELYHQFTHMNNIDKISVANPTGNSEVDAILNKILYFYSDEEIAARYIGVKHGRKLTVETVKTSYAYKCLKNGNIEFIDINYDEFKKLTMNSSVGDYIKFFDTEVKFTNYYNKIIEKKRGRAMKKLLKLVEC